MNKKQVESWLRQMYKGKDWFHSVGWDQFGRAIVYVKYMNSEIIRLVPDVTEDGKQILCHFASSLLCNKDQFLSKPQETNSLTTVVQATDLLSPEKEERMMEMQVQTLTNELDRLERICGSNILQDIFYEVHDGINAVTNLSAKFPEVSQRMRKLYDKYGFDIIYEELDG
jgi:hypothetical protein